MTEKPTNLIPVGAVPVVPRFSVATPDQSEVIHDEHRYLITPHDAAYDRYADLLDRADLPHIVNDDQFGSAAVVVGEISRDARTLPQIMRSQQAEHGMTSKDVFYITGRTIQALASATGMIPDAKGFLLGRTLILRDEAAIMFVPPMEFVPGDPQHMHELVASVEQQLLPEYERFGAIALLEAFERGLEA